MSREIATLLTGRNITVRIFPLSFSEYIRFKGVDISTGNRLLLEKQRHLLRHELHNFLQWGCFPEVTLEQSDEVRARLLSQACFLGLVVKSALESADQTGKKQGLKVSCDEGLSTHISPESCAGNGNIVGKALTRESAG